MTLLLALLGCTDEKPGACEGFSPEAWDPEWEEDVRVDEATAVWTASGAGTIDAASTTCAAPPCLALTGPVVALTDLLVNRGLDHTLGGTLVSDVPVTVRVAHLASDGAMRTLVETTYEPGTTELAEPFVLRVAGADARVTLTLEEAGTATLDGFVVTGPRWAPSSAAPAGTVRLGFLVHVEDDANFAVEEDTWRRRARVLEGLSATLAAHGAKLGIQADASFIRGATTWDPDWVHAREDEGAGWSVHIHDESDPALVEPAIRDGRTALREAGLGSTDLNGGFLTADWNAAALAGFTSISAFKDPETQLGLPRVQLQPWRPADGAGAADPDAFLAHDPEGPLLYLPGHDVREADHARFPDAASDVLSQVLAHARADHVNTWYFVLHVDGFGPSADDGDALDEYLDTTFADDLAYYDALLASLAPLVSDGAIVYDTPVGMASAWRDWNAPCEEE